MASASFEKAGLPGLLLWGLFALSAFADSGDRIVKPTSFSVAVKDDEGKPVWVSGEIAMDRVDRTGLGFLDAEPEAGATATRWWEVRWAKH